MLHTSGKQMTVSKGGDSQKIQVGAQTSLTMKFSMLLLVAVWIGVSSAERGKPP